MRAWFAVIVTTVALSAPVAHAQDVDVADAAEAVDDAERAAPEVVEAWTVPADELERVAAEDSRESEAWARIHDADEALAELEAAERMVGFDLLDGVR